MKNNGLLVTPIVLEVETLDGKTVEELTFLAHRLQADSRCQVDLIPMSGKSRAPLVPQA